MPISKPANHIFDFTPETLRAWFEQRKLPGFKAAQVLDWVYAKGVVDPALMSNLSKREREILSKEMTFLSGEIIADRIASDGTRKLLVEWGSEVESAPPAPAAEPQSLSLPLAAAPAPSIAGYQTECVMIPAEDASGDRRTACISSQVGCPVGCAFCASGIGGLDANLTPGRIVEQVWLLRDAMRGPKNTAPGAPPAEFPRITNIVFMGMGEPLANFAAVMHAVRTIAAPWGMGISARKITVSTVGLPKAIERLAAECELPITLALSLHAPNDELRRTLIPWAEYTTIPELLAACSKWFEKTGREITLEYILLGGINDRPEHARQLAQLARTLRANVNLIRYNEVKGMPFNRPRDADVQEFQRILQDARINSHIRASRGRDIAAACGQLRHEKRAG